MTTMIIRAKEGVPLVSPMVNLTLPTNVNAQNIMPISAGAAQIGTKSMKLTRVRYRSNAVGANEWLHIGTGVGAGFLDLIPPILAINNMEDTIEVPEAEAFATITAFPFAILGGSIDVQVEVEEKG